MCVLRGPIGYILLQDWGCLLSSKLSLSLSPDTISITVCISSNAGGITLIATCSS